MLILLLFVQTTIAQKYTLNFNNTPLPQALAKVSENYGIKFAFDAEKLNKIIVKKKVTSKNPEDILRLLLDGTGFTFEFVHQTYLILEDKKPPVQQVYNLMGSVTDAETGEKLAYTTLSLSNQNLNMFASDNGSYYFRNLKSGNVRLTASYIGYFQTDTLLHLKQPYTNFNIRLKRKLQNFDTLVVQGISLEMIDLRNDVDFATTVNLSKVNDLPQLTGTDVFKTLQLLPGIKYFENSSELSIRGGTSDQNLILYDGQTLYSISHFFGLFSALNPNIIKDVQVYKGGFDSKYGERVSGIIDITGKTGTQTKTKVSGEVSLFSGNLSVEIPLHKKWTLVAAARRSYSDIYATGLTKSMLNQTVIQVRNNQTNLQNESRPSFNFYDYNAKLTYNPGEREKISLSIYGGNDFFKNSYFSKSTVFNVNTNDKTTWDNFGVSAIWQKQWNKQFYTTLLGSSSGYSNDYNNSTNIRFLDFNSHRNNRYLPDSLNQFNSESHNRLRDYSLQLKNIWYLNSNHQVNFGILARINSIEYFKNAEKIYVYDSISQSSLTSSAYIQDKFSLLRQLFLKPGIRISFFGGNKQLYFEPRLSVNYRMNDVLSVRAATGTYYQFLGKVSSQEETGYYKNFWVLSDNSHPVLKSNHYIVGATFEKSEFLIDLEGYFKYLNGIEEYIYISEFLNKDTDFKKHFKKPKKNNPAETATPASFFINGSGQSYGLDLLFRYRYKKMTSWLSGSLGKTRSRFKDINQNSFFPSGNDQTCQISWANMVSKRRWNFGSVVLYSTGRPYFNTTGTTDLTRTWSRLPDYFRTDLSANYSFSLAKADVKAGFSIINLFDTKNYFEVNSRNFDFENASFSETNQMLSQDLAFNVFLVFEI